MDRLTWLAVERERAVGGAMVILGAAFVVATYFGVRSDRYLVSQMARITAGGIGGLLLLAAGAAALIIGDLLDDWRKLDRIEGALVGSVPPTPSSWLPNVARPAVAMATVSVVGAAIAIGLAWDQAASVRDPKPGLRALAVAVAALVAGAAGLAGATFALVRTVRLRESRLLAPWLLADLQSRLPVVLSATPAAVPAAIRSERVVTGGVLTHYHRPGCAALATGGPYHDIAVIDLPTAVKPCGLCFEEAEL
jgi:hypothetical protein